MNKIKIIHHNDLDGYIAGTILKIKYPNAQCFSVNYDNPENFPSLNNFNEGDIVFMVDYCSEAETMKWFKNNTNFYWIDHHISSVENSKKYEFDDIKGIRKVGLCGAQLTWLLVTKDLNIPDFIKLTGDYDTFRRNKQEYHNNEVMPFFFGTQIHMNQMNPCNYNNFDFMFKTFDDFKDEIKINQIKNEGKIIFQYKKETGKIENDLNCFVRNLWGYRVLCMNSCGRGSDQFTIPETWNPELHDMMLVYYFNGNNWCYGFYTNKENIDVSKIAIQYNGGGHKGAAGAITDYLIEGLNQK